MNADAHRYRIVPIGSGPEPGWAVERDGKISRSGGSLEVLGDWLDARLAGASEHDASDIAEVIARRPRPSYEERRAVFKPTCRSRRAIPSPPSPRAAGSRRSSSAATRRPTVVDER